MPVTRPRSLMQFMPLVTLSDIAAVVSVKYLACAPPLSLHDILIFDCGRICYLCTSRHTVTYLNAHGRRCYY